MGDNQHLDLDALVRRAADMVVPGNLREEIKLLVAEVRRLRALNRQEHFSVEGDTMHVEFWYPPHTAADAGKPNANPRYAILGLTAVRAADDVRVSYDFERDGWKVEQAQVFSWPLEGPADPEWKEVAFVQAWASKRDVDEDL